MIQCPSCYAKLKPVSPTAELVYCEACGVVFNTTNAEVLEIGDTEILEETYEQEKIYAISGTTCS